jgi:hypothetical protein
LGGGGVSLEWEFSFLQKVKLMQIVKNKIVLKFMLYLRVEIEFRRRLGMQKVT